MIGSALEMVVNSRVGPLVSDKIVICEDSAFMRSLRVAVGVFVSVASGVAIVVDECSGSVRRDCLLLVIGSTSATSGCGGVDVAAFVRVAETMKSKEKNRFHVRPECCELGLSRFITEAQECLSSFKYWTSFKMFGLQKFLAFMRF